MKICIFDHLGSHKTTQQLEKGLAARGHEVRWNMYYDKNDEKDFMGWCDVAFFEWVEGMMEFALHDGWGKKKPVYARAMDIEVWANNAAGCDFSDLSGLAYTSQEIFKVFKKQHNFDERFPNLKTTHLPLSIDMSEWTFKERKPGKNVAVIGHFWGSKGECMIPQFVKQLIYHTGDTSWKFYLQGNWRDDVWRWYKYYMMHIIRELGLEDNIILNEERVDSMDAWMDDKDYLITFSMKDAFSIIVGEAMAKGIKALPHNFPGAKDIWGPYVWSSFHELNRMLLEEPYNSTEYHNYVKNLYSNEVIIPKFEKFIGL